MSSKQTRDFFQSNMRSQGGIRGLKELGIKISIELNSSVQCIFV